MARQPYQYVLRFPSPPPTPQINKPHLVYYDGQWHLFRNKWKSQFRGKPNHAACISGRFISVIEHRLEKDSDRGSFGYYLKKRPS